MASNHASLSLLIRYFYAITIAFCTWIALSIHCLYASVLLFSSKCLKTKIERISIMHRYFALFLIGLIIFSMVSFVAPSVEAKDGPKIRVLAYTDEEAVAAEESGCKKVRETKGLKAFVCTEDVATRLGLSEDIRVFAVDSSANSQIGANTVQQVSGNTGKGTIIVIL